jgi:hypothetical protein
MLSNLSIYFIQFLPSLVYISEVLKFIACILVILCCVKYLKK